MNKKNYINSIDQLRISEDFNERTEQLMKNARNQSEKKNNMNFNTKKLVFSLASLAVVATVGTFAWSTLQNGPAPEGNKVVVATDSNENSTMIAESESKGITIPLVELPKNQNGDVEAKMMGLFVYKGRIYIQGNTTFQMYENYLLSEEDVENLKGEYLGKTTGTITEWSTQDDYAKEFASTIGGAEVYTIKGYDSQYRLMVYTKYEGGFDAQIYDSFGGLTLNTGADYFSLLNLKGNTVSYDWESFDSWNNGKNERETSTEATGFEDFMNALYASTPIGENTDMLLENQEYDSQKFVYVKTKDKLVTCLRLFKDGYVYAQGAGFFQVDPTAFNAFWDALPVSQTPTESIDPAGGSDISLSQAEVILTPDSYPVGTKSITLVLKNNSSKELWYGMEYQLEQEIDGVWSPVPAAADLMFIEIAKLLEPNSEQDFEIDLSLLSPALEAGNYRITKQIDGQVCIANFSLTK